MDKFSKCVGWDVHQETIAVAVAQAGSEIRDFLLAQRGPHEKPLQTEYRSRKEFQFPRYSPFSYESGSIQR